MTLERTERIRICGSAPTAIIRHEYHTVGLEAALKAAAECTSGLSDAEIESIAKGETRLVGRSDLDNIRIEDEPTR